MNKNNASIADPPNTDPPNTDPPNTDPPNTDPPNTDPPNADPPNTDLELPGALKSIDALKDIKSVEELQALLKDIPKVPKDYELPEGAPEALSDWAKENKFTQAQLSAALQMYTESMTKTREAQINEYSSQTQQLFKEWGDQAETNKSLAMHALSFGDPEGELRQFLKESGADSHPLVWKFMLEVGKSLKEGGFVESQTSTPANPGKSVAKALFPNFK